MGETVPAGQAANPGSDETKQRGASRPRCFGEGDPLMERYHDEEWGFPVLNERGLFERMSLEAFQSGLSWRTILNKRDAFRVAFANFEPERVARFGARDVSRLLADAEIVRNRAKIEATLANAKATVALRPAEAARCADTRLRARARGSAAGQLGGCAGKQARDGRARARAEATRLSLCRADDALRADAGLRPGRRPPRQLPGTARRRAGASRRWSDLGQLVQNDWSRRRGHH